MVDNGESEAPIWQRLRNLASSVEVQSVKVGPATLRFNPRAERTDAFALVARKVARTSERPVDVFVVTAHNVDEVIQVDRIDADHECEAYGAPRLRPGGSGANTAFALAALGARVTVAGCVGPDDLGDLLRHSLVSATVDTENLDTVEGQSSGRTLNLVEKGGRRLLVVHQHANAKFAQRFSVDRLESLAIRARAVHLSSFVDGASLDVQERLAAEISSKALVSLTPGALYAKRGLDRLEILMSHVDLMFLYREQLETMIGHSSAKGLLSGTDGQHLLEAYFAWKSRRGLDRPQILVIKDPSETSTGRVRQRYLAVGCGSGSLERFFYPQELPNGVELHALDTTGAGDATAAGFIMGLLNDGSLESCLDASFLLAAFTSSELGARTAFESPSEITSGSVSPTSLVPPTTSL